jgi:DNA polymerase-3 subunit epsilon
VPLHEADTMATYDINGTLDRYPDLENDMKSLSEFSTRKKNADFAGMIAFDKDDEEILLLVTQRSFVDTF